MTVRALVRSCASCKAWQSSTVLSGILIIGFCKREQRNQCTRIQYAVLGLYMIIEFVCKHVYTLTEVEPSFTVISVSDMVRMTLWVHMSLRFTNSFIFRMLSFGESAITLSSSDMEATCWRVREKSAINK